MKNRFQGVSKLILTLIVAMVMASNVYAQKAIYAEEYEKISDNGAWCWFADPRAIYVDGKMIGGYVDNQGSIWAFSYDPATDAKEYHKLYDKLDFDDHANPSFMQLPDKRVAIFFSAHGGTKNSPMYFATTKKPGDITSWSELQEIDPKTEGKFGICYSNPAMLSAENNRTYLFFRGRDFKPNYIFSDDLKTWSNATTLVTNDAEYGDYGRPYMKTTTNGRDKIFFAFTDAHPRDRATNSIYFMLYKNGKLYGADGRVISENISDAITPSQVDKVYDASKTFDKAWIWDVAYDKDENPVIVYARFSHSTAQHSYWYARWTGQEWDNQMITKAGQWFQRADYKKESPEYENNYSGGVYLDHENPSIVYTSRPINDVFEIEKWTLNNGKWTPEAITKESSRDNVRPFVARGYRGDQPSVLWMYNYKYPGFRDYNSAIRVNKLAKGFDASFKKESIEKVANAVFDWQVEAFNSEPWSDNEQRGWRTGVLYNGMFDWAELTNNDDYFKFMTRIFSRQYWQLGNRMYHADELCVGQVYLDMYAKYKKEDMMIPTKARLDWIISNPAVENIDITKGKSDRWWWCDALYMGPAVFTRMYALTGDKKYVEFAHREFQATYDHLFDKDEHLFLRDAKYIGKLEANGSKIFWSRGNGWVMGGLVEILKTLPENDTQYRPYYVALFKKMCQRIASLQSQDGFWRSSLLDPTTYSEPETSGTGLFTYAMAYGINQGYLPGEQYMPVVTKGWQALVSSVDTEGKLGWVQIVAQTPGANQKKNTEVYGVGGFLMTAAEIYKFAE